MNRTIKNKNYIFGIVFLIICTSCAKLDVPSEYIIDEKSLIDSLKRTDKTLVLFWTGWCPASEYRIENYYLPLNDIIKKNDLDLKLILLASDANITLEDIDQLRNIGISCYYIEKPGGFAIANRMAIKNFINNAFPDNEISRISKFQYGIPVELLITKDLEIVNEKETSKSIEFISKILDAYLK